MQEIGNHLRDSFSVCREILVSSERTKYIWMSEGQMKSKLVTSFLRQVRGLYLMFIPEPYRHVLCVFINSIR